MRRHALTYPQLMNQALEQRLDGESLALLKRSFDFALPLVDGMYRAQGVPFIDHFVRTASIVLAEEQPTPVVSAAMLHGAFFLHSFTGSRRRRARKSDRATLRRELGEYVGDLVEHYSGLPWSSAKTLREHISVVSDCSTRTRHVLVIRLANELEDHLDRAMSYSVLERSSNGVAPYLPECVELADALGFQGLAADLRELVADKFAPPVPAELASTDPRGFQLRHQRWRSNILERIRYRAEEWVRR